MAAAAARRMFEQEAAAPPKPRARGLDGTSPAAASPEAAPALPTSRAWHRQRQLAMGANAVIAYLLFRRSCALVHHRRDIASAKLIQAELRDFLARTSTFARQLRRRRAADDRLRREAAVARLLGEVQSHGRAICGEEAATLAALRAAMYAERCVITQADEAAARQVVAALEQRTIDALYQREVPDELKPGTVVGQEARRRAHLTRGCALERAQITQAELLARSRWYHCELHAARAATTAAEAAERYAAVASFRVAFIAVRLQEEEQAETALRAVFEERRCNHVRALTARRALLALTILAGPERQCEAGARQQLEDAERDALLDLHQRFCQRRLVIASSDLLFAEHTRRFGSRGVASQEAREWAAIVRAVVGVALQRLQFDDPDAAGSGGAGSVRSESGARAAIEHAEFCARFALTQTRTAAQVGVLVPREEASSRARIERHEAVAFRGIISGGELLHAVAALMEPAGRRGVFREWCGGAAALLLFKATIDAAAGEERRRRGLRAAEEAQREWLASAEYLCFVELRERSLLHQCVGRARERLTLASRHTRRTVAPGGAVGEAECAATTGSSTYSSPSPHRLRSSSGGGGSHSPLALSPALAAFVSACSISPPSNRQFVSTAGGPMP